MLKFIEINFLHYLYLIILLNFINEISCRASIRQLEKKILDNILGKDYDNRIRPSGINSTNVHNDGACIVTVNIFVRSISRIDDVTMEYATQITFREEWSDDRLKYNNVSGIRFLTLTEPEKIWKPDLFFSNEKEGHFHNIIMPNVLLRIYPDGKVLYSIRISLVLFCPMHLKYFPLDMQTCRIQMASYGYTTEDLIFLWKKNSPVQITRPLNLPRFKLIKSKTNYCTSRTNTGEYSCIYVDLIFKREFSYYLILIYVPCCMLVIVSWVSFWIDPNSTAARVLLGVTSLLTMSRQNSGINASLPPVSYTKAVDVWTGCCLTFVFGALIEFAVVNYVSRQDAHKKVRRRLHAIKQNDFKNCDNSDSIIRCEDGDSSGNFFSTNHGAINSNSNQINHRKRASVRSYSRKKLESGKDSGIESDDLEEVIATRYVKSLGATKLSTKNVKDKPITGQQDLLGSFSQDTPLVSGSRISPPAQYASQTKIKTSHLDTHINNNGNQSQVLLNKKQNLFNQTNQIANQKMVNNYINLPGVQPVYRGTSALNCAIGNQEFVNSPNDAFNNVNNNTNFVNLVVNSQQKTNAIKAKRSHNFFMNWLNRFPTRSKRIDVLSRICFPLLFALFNVFYWITYLLRDELINS